MFLQNWKTPSVSKKIIEWDGPFATVIREHKLWHLSGSLYMGPDSDTQPSDNHICLYRYFSEMEAGYRISYFFCDSKQEAERLGKIYGEINTADDFLSHLKDQMRQGKQIGPVDIELARRCSPQMADECRAHNYAVLLREYEERQKEASMSKEERAAIKKAEREKTVQRGNAKTQQIIDSAIKKILEGGIVISEEIEVHFLDDEGYADYKTYSLINHLARIYGVNIPIRTKGWIAKHLRRVEIEDGKAARCWATPGNRGSTSFWGCMNALIGAVKEKEEKSA